MAYMIRKVNYCKMTVPSRAGQGVKILGVLKDAGVDLIAFTGFPIGGGKSQIDLVAIKMAGIQRVAKKNKWQVSKTKKGFLVQGTDEIGAAHKVLSRLAKENVNIVAADAVAAGKGRYGMLMWVRPQDFNRAARILNAQ
jgi:hypothetical protein